MLVRERMLAAVRNGVIPAVRRAGFLRRDSAAFIAGGEVGDVAGM
jgi:hypothetical protein